MFLTFRLLSSKKAVTPFENSDPLEFELMRVHYIYVKMYDR